MTCWCKGICPIIRNVEQLEESGRDGEAELALKTALIDSPGCVEGNLALARMYTDSNRACFATEHLARAQKTQGKNASLNPKIALATARAAKAQAKIPASLALYSFAVTVDPKNADARAQAIGAFEAAGELDEGMNFALRARLDFPEDQDVRRATAAMLAARKDYTAAEDTISAGGNMRPLDYLDRGRYRDKLGNVAGAWDDWGEGKRILREQRRFMFQKEVFDNVIFQLVSFATPKRLKHIPPLWPAPNKDGPQPIFVLGFPRSGTTMTETAISSHSAIVAGDELQLTSEIIRLMPLLLGVETPYPYALMAAGISENVTALGQLRDWYLRRAMFRLAPEGWPAGTKFFTDKMCLNEIHIPFLLALFPRSPIFVVRRHPLDVIISNWSYFIRHGWNYGASLRSMAHALVTVDALVDRYRNLFPGKIHIVPYEKFVRDPGAELGPIFDRIPGIALERACLAPESNPRYSRTISHRQIKEPVHDRSVGRWKAYREKFPQFLIDAVRPICERDGHEL